MKTAKFRKMTAIILALAVSIGTFTSASALSDGAYTADTLTFYLNPDTGTTDDGGTANPELGEGMCRSAVYKTALVEQQNGSTWITLRMLLYSNISNIKLYTQNSPEGSYTEAKYTIKAENSTNDSADLWFKAPSADCYIKTTMYVTPMGRDVCFYWKVDTSTASSGNGDFIKTIKEEAGTTGGFTDINGHWASDAIQEAVAKGLFSGTTDTTFSPDGVMTRGMFVTVLGRLSGESVSSYNSSFSDVSKGAYYGNYVAWANAKGIVSGTSAKTFSPDDPITREQAAAIIVKYAAYKGITLKTSGTAPTLTYVSSWAASDVMKAGKAGIVSKQNTGDYRFKNSTTRAEVASMLINFSNSYL